LAQHPDAGPIRRELERRAFVRAAELGTLAPELAELAPRAYSVSGDANAATSFLEKLKTLDRGYEELREISGWIGPSLSTMSDNERNEALAAMQSVLLAEGFTPLKVVDALKAAQQPAAGRPSTKRHLALTALDMWLTNPKLSWAQVTRRVCNCGKSDHGMECQEQLRQQVNDLRSFLKRLGIEVLPRSKAQDQ
jgi:hypothetical protein